MLGQEAIDDKSNEITTNPKLLKILDIKGCIITIDAMGCQHVITDQIIDQKGNYVIDLKGNQGYLHDDFSRWPISLTLKGFPMIFMKKLIKITAAWR